MLIGLAVVLGLSLLFAPLAAEAQQRATIARVGYFGVASPSMSTAATAQFSAFREGLRELGWLEGQNVLIETRWGEGKTEDFPRIASELVALPVDVIVTSGPEAIHAVQQATATIPIVMAIVHEPLAFGFIKSLARPGGNITGLSFQDSELVTKRLELLKEIVPRMRRVALVWNASGGGEMGRRAAEAAAQQLGLTAHALEVRRPEDVQGVLASAKKGRAQAVVQLASPFLSAYRKGLIESAIEHRLPMTCETRFFVADGCLMAYGPSFIDMWRRAATYVDKILKGAKPADLPVEQPTKFELVINSASRES